MTSINFEISKLLETRESLFATINNEIPVQSLTIKSFGEVKFSNTEKDEGDHLPGGGCARNMIDAYTQRDKFYEPLLAAVFIQIGKHLDDITLFDIGALWGNTSFVAGLTSKNFVSHMFEMNPYTCEVLRRNIELNENSYRKYFLHNILLANSNDEVDVTFKHYTARYNDGQGGTGLSKLKILRRNIKSNIRKFITKKNVATFDTIKMQVMKLDKFVEKSSLKPNVIKIDVEGSQYDILVGAEKYLSMHKPILLIEFDEPGAANYIGKSNRQVVEYLERYGYKCIWGDHRNKNSPVFLINSKTEKDIEKNSLGIFY
jgi:FkbM family methyltransferase